VRLTACQLGLFGWGDADRGEQKRIARLDPLDPALAGAIGGRAEDGRIACAAVFAVADEFRTARQHAADAAETLGLKIFRCTWGCF
jgi:hypothetical protein